VFDRCTFQLISSFSVNRGALVCLLDQDAWFETAKVDESLQAKKKKEREKAKEDTELTKEDRWVIQKRIADTLQPGETVCSSLKFFAECSVAFFRLSNVWFSLSIQISVRCWYKNLDE
jgi:hypothetical protein